MEIIPEFSFVSVFVEPWVDGGMDTLMVVLMGFFVTAACGLIGNYIMLRKMSLLGDAISHSLLPGIAIAFLLTSSRATGPLFIGALLTGVLTVLLIEFIEKHSKVKIDAAMGIVFSTFFALGIIIITIFADKVDLDVDCVLYGEIAFVPLVEHVEFAGFDLGPYPLTRMFGVFTLLLLAIVVFYKELLVSVFDPGLARILGVKPKVFRYGLTVALSLVLVSAFKSVGAILVVGMMLFPGATARLLTFNLKKIMLLTVVFAAIYPLIGIHLATWLDCSIAAAMTVVAVFILVFVWASKAIRLQFFSV